MALSAKDVEHVALLSRLELGPEETRKFTDELTKIFTYVEQLDQLDVSGVPPTAHPLPMKDVFREDVVRTPLSNSEALSNAPEKEDGCFRVPQIV